MATQPDEKPRRELYSSLDDIQSPTKERVGANGPAEEIVRIVDFSAVRHGNTRFPYVDIDISCYHLVERVLTFGISEVGTVRAEDVSEAS